MPPAGWPQPKLAETRAKDAIGKPLRAIACTDVKGGVLYLCEWQNGARKFLSAAAVTPEIILPFLEVSVLIVNANNVDVIDFRGNHTFYNY